MCAGFSFKKTSTVSLSIDVRITMISGVVYLLRIFKMFHGLMNNPVLLDLSHHDVLGMTCSTTGAEDIGIEGFGKTN